MVYAYVIKKRGDYVIHTIVHYTKQYTIINHSIQYT